MYHIKYITYICGKVINITTQPINNIVIILNENQYKRRLDSCMYVF